jgi:hypothetical protein
MEENNQPIEQVDKWAKKVFELNQKYPVARELGGDIGRYLEQNKALLSSEDCLEKALLAVLAEGYKLGDRGQGAGDREEGGGKREEGAERREERGERKDDERPLPEVVSERGLVPAVLPLRPKTIAEAGEMARSYFRSLRNS